MLEAVGVALKQNMENKDKEPEVEIKKVFHKATQPECVRPTSDSQTCGILFENPSVQSPFAASFASNVLKSLLVVLVVVPLGSV